jgi:hypothetical protein
MAWDASVASSLVDITYATPINLRMRENGLHKPHVNPVLTAQAPIMS